ncbi:UNVERIFIED_CONTAM: hypothetical protein Slati_0172200 [Sesamum latifolium]|uniref:Uncharacterized protein n=1 Tax=Sesamum latifolium TaxID=2727402 RepID=A0AAW2YB48_9LAMI
MSTIEKMVGSIFLHALVLGKPPDEAWGSRGADTGMSPSASSSGASTSDGVATRTRTSAPLVLELLSKLSVG